MMKNLRIRTKQLLGFSIVIFLSALLSIFAIFSLNSVSSSYQNVMNYSQQRLQSILDIKYNVMDIRRITTAINAYCGDVTRQEGYKTESARVCAEVYASADTYVKLVEQDKALSQREKNTLKGEAESLKSVLSQYKRDLIDANIEYAIANDKAAVVSNASSQASLISTLQKTIVDLTDSEQQIEELQSKEVAAETQFYQTFFIALSILTIAIALFLAFYISGLISTPINAVATVLEQIGTKGDLSLDEAMQKKAIEYNAYKDEIGACCRSVGGLIAHLTHIEEELRSVADGDLSIEIATLSERDNIGISVSKVVSSLNDMFSEIHASTKQVSTASRQIAGDAQTLSQGSAEQASAVEQLSSSITAIADKTTINADMAGRAAKLAEAIKISAEKGTRQMNEMMSAVKEINQASHSINKVIKVIDDIAFQTNILALNAAVEAARAGQHGKGFAVVAEEVRSLAAKSADAAKNTGSLIANSINKAELGARIADETAASLVEIVSGINESTKLVSDIARSSGEQSEGISQINKGIEQVANVIHQNSTAAEESAAASVEMSDQSDVLQNLVAQFKLKSNSRLPAFAPSSNSVQLPLLPKAANSEYGKY